MVEVVQAILPRPMTYQVDRMEKYENIVLYLNINIYGIVSQIHNTYYYNQIDLLQLFLIHVMSQLKIDFISMF